MLLKIKAIMEKLLVKSKQKINRVPDSFFRYLYQEINFSSRLIAVLGARGTGKTTLLLQIAKHSNKDVLYVALDDLFFTQNTLYSLSEDFKLNGGELLLLDEVHKYPGWSREIKLIYDDFPELQVIFTSSSILDIYKGESDLSRRAVNYHLSEMSFREYLQFYHKISLSKLSLSDIISNNEKLSLEISSEIKPLKYLKEYIATGAYPYYSGYKDEYYQLITNTINLILDVDLQSIEGIEYANIAKFKRLLYILANNVPFTPNISKLAGKIDLHRNTLIQGLQLLEKAELIRTKRKQNKSISILSKPDKIWLHNTNLSFAISDNNPDTGNVRETFFLQHLQINHNVGLADKGDFVIDNNFIFEVGGQNKTKKQISGLENAYVVRDNIETGAKNIIPLWLFGLLY